MLNSNLIAPLLPLLRALAPISIPDLSLLSLSLSLSVVQFSLHSPAAAPQIRDSDEEEDDKSSNNDPSGCRRRLCRQRQRRNSPPPSLPPLSEEQPVERERAAMRRWYG